MDAPPAGDGGACEATVGVGGQARPGGESGGVPPIGRSEAAEDRKAATLGSVAIERDGPN